MDRVLRLVVQTRPGVDALYPIPVRHPVPLRYPALAGRLPPGVPSPTTRCHTAIPFASIRLGLGLALTSEFGNHRLTLKIMCRARHTPKHADGQAADVCVQGAYALWFNIFTSIRLHLKYMTVLHKNSRISLTLLQIFR